MKIFKNDFFLNVPAPPNDLLRKKGQKNKNVRFLTLYDFSFSSFFVNALLFVCQVISIKIRAILELKWLLKNDGFWHIWRVFTAKKNSEKNTCVTDMDRLHGVHFFRLCRSEITCRYSGLKFRNAYFAIKRWSIIFEKISRDDRWYGPSSSYIWKNSVESCRL